MGLDYASATYASPAYGPAATIEPIYLSVKAVDLPAIDFVNPEAKGTDPISYRRGSRSTVN